MKRNIVIFLIVLILFIVIAIVAYVIYYLQQRMGFARQPPSESEMSEPRVAIEQIPKKRENTKAIKKYYTQSMIIME
ncbi:hypothetical protein NpNSSI1_00012494 [Neofusicoccum parvum]|nr:hypothetical protein NpNSSI1_00012494 [Neofusicoccum parvum]